MSWRSPKSNNGQYWETPEYAYDEQLGTYGVSPIIISGYWSEMTYFYVSPPPFESILCDKVRLRFSQLNGYLDSLKIYVLDTDYYDHLIYYGPYPIGIGDYPGLGWREYEIPGGPLRIVGVAVKAKAGDDDNWMLLYEVDFNQIAAVRPLVGGSLAGSGLIGKGLVR